MGWITRRQNAGSYIARYRDPSGRERSKSFRTKAEARAFLASVETAKQRGDWMDPRRGKIKFREFAVEWLKTTVQLKPSTRVSSEMLLRRHIVPYFGDVPLARIERINVQRWMATLIKNGAGPGTVRNAYRVLARVLGEAQRSRVIAHNPAARIGLPKSRKEEMRFFTPEEIRSLAELITPRYRALILTAGYTGLRWGELTALRGEHLDLLRGTIEVRQALTEAPGGRVQVVSTKTGAHRTVPVPRFLTQVLAEHLAAYPSAQGWVFSAEHGGPLRRNNFASRHLKPALRAAGLDMRARFHDLRHSAASMAINAGANVKQVQQMLGHASATVTLDTYSHVFPSLAEQLREGLDAAYRAAEEPEAQAKRSSRNRPHHGG